MVGTFLTCYPYASQTGNKMMTAQEKVQTPITYPTDQAPPVLQTPSAVESNGRLDEFLSTPQDRIQMNREKRSSNNDNSSSQASALPIPEVASAQTTSTASPGCRQRKSVEKASKSTFLTETDFSRVTEMCMGMNEQPLTRLWSMMGAISQLRTKRGPMHQITKEDHAKDEISRLTLGQYLTVSDGTKTVCVGPSPKLKRHSLYKLMEGVQSMDGFHVGVSIYLLTGWNKEHGAVTWERLIVNNSFAEIATIFLGTTDMWRLSGNIELTSRVKGHHEISIDVDGLGVTLTRQVTKWSVLYTVEIRVEVLDGKSYDGLLWGIYSGEAGLLGFKKATSLRDNDCYPLNQSVAKQYTTSPFEFTHYFLDLLYDLTKNLPTYMFE